MVPSIAQQKNELIKTSYTCVPPDLSAHSNGSDCGYSSSLEGSETGSREGSDVACSEGMCNHDEAGWVFCGLFFSSNWFREQYRNSLVSYNHILSYCVDFVQEITYTPITVQRTRKRMEQTAVSTAGLTLKEKFNARAKRRKENPTVYATTRWGGNPEVLPCTHSVLSCLTDCAHFHREKKGKAVRRMGTRQPTAHYRRTCAEPKKSSPLYVVIHLTTAHYNYRGQYVQRSAVLMQGLQTSVLWSFWLVQNMVRNTLK